MGEVSVAVCLIVRDAARTLGLCLRSIAELADEIIVYDTGSTDGSVERARAAGATVILGEWHDDFSRARNACLQYATADWVLCIDADEMAVMQAGPLRQFLAECEPDVDAFAIETRNAHGPDRGGLEHYQETKLFRRTACHYSGWVHERLERADRSPARTSLVPSLLLRHIHFGYSSPAVVQAKAARNARIAAAELAALRAESPADERDLTRVLLDLGRSLASSGRAAEADELFSEIRSFDRGDAEWLWATSFRAQLALADHRLEQALELADELTQRPHGRAFGHWVAGRVLVQREQWTEAHERFAQISELVDVGGRALDPTVLMQLRSGVAERIRSDVTAA